MMVPVKRQPTCIALFAEDAATYARRMMQRGSRVLIVEVLPGEKPEQWARLIDKLLPDGARPMTHDNVPQKPRKKAAKKKGVRK